MNAIVRLQRFVLTGWDGIGATSGALKIVCSYALFASLWILLSDQVVGLLVQDPARIVQVSTLKGSLFVAATSLLLFLLVRRFGLQLANREQEQASAEKALKANEAMFQALAEGASDAFFVHDLQGRFQAVNDKACANLGYSQEELLGLRVQDVDPAAQGEATLAMWAAATLGQPFTMRGRHRRKDGTTFPVEIRGSAFLRHERKLFLGVVRDLSDTETAAHALAESESRFAAAFQWIPVGLGLTRRRDSVFIHVNQAFSQLSGYEPSELEGKTAVEIKLWADPAVRSGIAADLDCDLPVLNRPVTFRKKDGSLAPVAFSAHPVVMQGVPCLLWAAVDVTAYGVAAPSPCGLAAGFQQAQQMENLGRLASGVAHDFNNVLAAIQSVAELLKRKTAGDHQTGLALDTITQATGRGSELVQTLRKIYSTAPQPLPARTEPGPPPAAPRPLNILLVDDDELIRASVPAMLGVSGHQVSTAEGGWQALTLLEQGLEVDLVILDLNMPELGGAETLPLLRALRPQLPVLVATGFLDAETEVFLATFKRLATMGKPFSLKDLQARLGQLCP